MNYSLSVGLKLLVRRCGLLRCLARGKKKMLIADNASYYHAADLNGWLQENCSVLKTLCINVSLETAGKSGKPG